MPTAKQWLVQATSYLPKTMRDTLGLRAFGALKVPLILYCMPQVQRVDQDACVIAVPLTWRTRNHYKSMYFGVLAIGADMTAGLLAMNLTQNSDKAVGLLFKDFKADFHKRAMGDVVFRCDDGALVRQMVDRVLASPERVNETVTVLAHCPSDHNALVATMRLTLSLKQTKH